MRHGVMGKLTVSIGMFQFISVANLTIPSYGDLEQAV